MRDPKVSLLTISLTGLRIDFAIKILSELNKSLATQGYTFVFT